MGFEYLSLLLIISIFSSGSACPDYCSNSSLWKPGSHCASVECCECNYDSAGCACPHRCIFPCPPDPPPTPTPPLFPTVYDTIQISSCKKESIYCPKGFSDQTIASHSYYDYTNKRMLGVDSNDISQPSLPKFAADQTFVTYNGSHTRTEIYGFAPGASSMSCIFTEYPIDAIPPPDMLQQDGTKYLGQSVWNNVPCDIWQSPQQYGGVLYYVSTEEQEWVGYATPDGSQEGFFVLFRARDSFPSHTFLTPKDVTCAPPPPAPPADAHIHGASSSLLGQISRSTVLMTN